MSDTRSTLRKIFKAGEPLVEQWLDISEQFAALRELAAEEELDWSQIKGRLKAKVQDGRDGGKRVEKLLGKADNATAYADLLGLGGKNNFSSEPSGNPGELRSAPEKPADAIEPAAVITSQSAPPSPAAARYAIPDDLSVPAFLARPS